MRSHFGWENSELPSSSLMFVAVSSEVDVEADSDEKAAAAVVAAGENGSGVAGVVVLQEVIALIDFVERIAD